jgi:hypothetical protein
LGQNNETHIIIQIQRKQQHELNQYKMHSHNHLLMQMGVSEQVAKNSILQTELTNIYFHLSCKCWPYHGQSKAQPKYCLAKYLVGQALGWTKHMPSKMSFL